MTLMLIIINFVFPPLGFSDPSINASQVPSFNLTKDTISFVQTVPEYPSRPSEGTLVYNASKSVYTDSRRVWIEGNSHGGYELVLLNNGTSASPEAKLIFNEYNSTGFVGRNVTYMTEADDYTTLSRDQYEIVFTSANFTNVNTSQVTLSVDWQITQTPAGASAVGQLPIIGGIASAVAGAIEQLTAVIGWIGSIFYNIGFNLIIVGTGNLLHIIYNIGVFIIGVAQWFILGYASVVNGAPANWLKPFLAIPSLIWSFEFAKLMIIFRGALPI